MTKKFTVLGMTCSACSSGIERNLSKADGIFSVSVSLLAKEMEVEFDENVISEQMIIALVDKIGYKAYVYGTQKQDRWAQAKKLKYRFFVSLIFLLPLLYFSMGNMIGVPTFSLQINFIITWVLATIIIAINFRFYINGVKALVRRMPNMDTLVSLGSSSAYIYSVIITIMLFLSTPATHTYFEASAMVLTLVTLGKWLEEISKVKTGDAIEKLNKLIPKTATVLKDGKMVTVLTSEIEVGDTVILRVGDYVSIDGVIVEGKASIDKSAITGESLPEEVTIDDFVSSGSMIKDGFIMVEAISVGKDTLFSKIIEIVKKAGTSKAPIQNIADKVAGVFVPIVSAISLITFAIWIFTTGNLYLSIGYAISVLVISCPCALGLATPVAIMASTGKGASQGILFKDAGAIQKMRKINCVLLDKTATITVGQPRVNEYINLSKLSDEKVKMIVSAMEGKSSHPLAQSIIEYCGQSNYELTEYDYILGKGIVAKCDGEQYYLGNKKLIELTKNLDCDYEKVYSGKTVIYFANDRELLAIFVVSDYLKVDSASAIKELNESGIKTVMITGDNESVAKSVCQEVGIQEYMAQVMPQDKYSIVQEYIKKGYYVAMAGDGINDSPALKEADVGIAMGDGTDIAIDSADVILVNGNLGGIVEGIKLSKKTVRVIKQNLFWAFFYNVIAIPISAGAFAFLGLTLTPMLASVCMSCSSLFVVTNALRISRKKKIKKEKVAKVCKDQKTYTYVVQIEKMTCNHCISKVKEGLEKQNYVTSAKVSLQNKKAIVRTNMPIAVSLITNLIEGLGYEVVNITSED